MNSKTDILPEYRKGITAEPLLLTAIMVLAIIASIFLPAKDAIIDSLLISTFCVTILIPLIVASVKQPGELASFAGYVFFSSLLQLMFSFLIFKALITNSSRGRVLVFLGGIFNSQQQNIYLALLAGFGLFCVWLTVFFAFLTNKKADLVLKQIVTAKLAGLRNDIANKRITKEKAIELGKRINSEKTFYYGMKSISKILPTHIIIITLIALFALTYIGAQKDKYYGAVINSTITASFFLYIMAIIESWFSFSILNKNNFKLRNIDQSAKDNTPIAFDDILDKVDENSAFELINPDFPNISNVVSKSKLLQAYNPDKPSPQERIIEFIENRKNEETENKKPISIDEFYDDITANIFEGINYGKTFFSFISETETQIPVGVPVNVAIRLSQLDYTILLVDGEKERNAVCDVFEISHIECSTNTKPTFINGLSIFKFKGSLEQLPKMDKEFDAIIFYSPAANITELKNITENSDSIYIAASSLSYTEKINELGKNHNCTVNEMRLPLDK